MGHCAPSYLKGDMPITIFDTETTGLIEAEGNDPAVQPHIIEICAIKFSDDGEIISMFESLIKPPIPIPEHLTKHVHHISDYDVKDSPIYAEVWRDIAKQFFGCHTVVSHNLSFDIGIIANEQKRIGRELNFPYPPIHFCTVEQSMHLKGYRLKNTELYTLATGLEIEGAHRAKNDVLATAKSYFWLKSGG